jgi:hypothetical protein
MDVIPLDATLVKGSHGRVNVPHESRPVMITDSPLDKTEISAVDVHDVIARSLGLIQ